MAAYTRSNGLGHVTSTLYETLQVRGFRIENPGTAFTDGIGGTIEALAQEFGTTGALMEASGDTFVIIGDGHALDVAIVNRRASKVLGVSESTLDVSAITSLFGIVNT
jgi:hypothetical protein